MRRLLDNLQAAERPEDFGQARHPRLRPAGPRLHARGGQRVRLLHRRRGCREGPGVHGGARARTNGADASTSTACRTRTARRSSRRTRSRAIDGAPGLRAAEVGRGHEEARPEKVQPPHDARPPRESRRSLRAGADERREAAGAEVEITEKCGAADLGGASAPLGRRGRRRHTQIDWAHEAGNHHWRVERHRSRDRAGAVATRVGARAPGAA